MEEDEDDGSVAVCDFGKLESCSFTRLVVVVDHKPSDFCPTLFSDIDVFKCTVFVPVVFNLKWKIDGV